MCGLGRPLRVRHVSASGYFEVFSGKYRLRAIRIQISTTSHFSAALRSRYHCTALGSCNSFLEIAPFSRLSVEKEIARCSRGTGMAMGTGDSGHTAHSLYAQCYTRASERLTPVWSAPQRRPPPSATPAHRGPPARHAARDLLIARPLSELGVRPHRGAL